MTNKLKDAFEKALCLSEEEQDDLAAALLLVVDNKLSPEDEADEAEWDALVGSDLRLCSKRWLRKHKKLWNAVK